MARHLSLESLSLLLVIAFTSFCIFDEEPVIDFTDWNSLHVGALVVSFSSVFFETTVRARFGQFVYKDQATLLALFSFWLGLENYMRLLFLVFALHTLTPLEVELLELVDVYNSMANFISTDLVGPFLLLTIAYGLTLGLGLALASLQRRVILAGLFVIFALVLVCFFFSIWDFLVASLSSLSIWYQSEIFYNQPKTGLTYDRGLGVSDQFEWHRERTWPYVMHFEDLYFFFFKLLFVWTLSCMLYFLAYLMLCLGFVQGYTITYTQLAIAALLFEHLLWLVFVFLLNFSICSVRLWARSPSEFAFFW